MKKVSQGAKIHLESLKKKDQKEMDINMKRRLEAIEA